LGVNETDFPVVLSLPEFDTSLGSLTGIQVTLNTTGLLEAEVENVGAAASFTSAAASGPITVSGPDGAAASVTPPTASFSGSIGSGTPSSPVFTFGPQTSLAGAGVSQVPASDFAAYEASGGGSLDFPLNAVFNGSFSGNGVSSLSFTGNASVYGSVEVDYTYSAAVPEPEDLLSLGLLCFGAFAGLRHREKM
jgi:hypothetical protein